MLPTITIDSRFHLNKVGPTRLLGLLTDKWLHHVGKGEVPRALVNPTPLKTRTPEFDAALLELKFEPGIGKSRRRDGQSPGFDRPRSASSTAVISKRPQKANAFVSRAGGWRT